MCAAAAAFWMAACTPRVSGDANGGMIAAFGVAGPEVWKAANAHCQQHGRAAGDVRGISSSANSVAFTCR